MSTSAPFETVTVIVLSTAADDTLVEDLSVDAVNRQEIVLVSGEYKSKMPKNIRIRRLGSEADTFKRRQSAAMFESALSKACTILGKRGGPSSSYADKSKVDKENLYARLTQPGGILGRSSGKVTELSPLGVNVTNRTSKHGPMENKLKAIKEREIRQNRVSKHQVYAHSGSVDLSDVAGMKKRYGLAMRQWGAYNNSKNTTPSTTSVTAATDSYRSPRVQLHLPSESEMPMKMRDNVNGVDGMQDRQKNGNISCMAGARRREALMTLRPFASSVNDSPTFTRFSTTAATSRIARSTFEMSLSCIPESASTEEHTKDHDEAELGQMLERNLSSSCSHWDLRSLMEAPTEAHNKNLDKEGLGQRESFLSSSQASCDLSSLVDAPMEESADDPHKRMGQCEDVLISSQAHWDLSLLLETPMEAPADDANEVGLGQRESVLSSSQAHCDPSSLIDSPTEAYTTDLDEAVPGQKYEDSSSCKTHLHVSVYRSKQVPTEGFAKDLDQAELGCERTSADHYTPSDNALLRFVKRVASTDPSLLCRYVFAVIKSLFASRWMPWSWSPVIFVATNTGSGIDSAEHLPSAMKSQHVEQEGVRQTGHLDDARLDDMAERGMLDTLMA